MLNREVRTFGYNTLPPRRCACAELQLRRTTPMIPPTRVPRRVIPFPPRRRMGALTPFSRFDFSRQTTRKLLDFQQVLGSAVAGSGAYFLLGDCVASIVLEFVLRSNPPNLLRPSSPSSCRTINRWKSTRSNSSPRLTPSALLLRRTPSNNSPSLPMPRTQRPLRLRTTC